MKKFFSIPVLLGILLLTASCTRNDAQREFESDAYTEPSGFSETTFQGEVISIDEDDWRISPLYQGLVDVFPIPYPNPTTTQQTIQFILGIRYPNALDGFEVVTRLPDNTPRILFEMYEGLPQGDIPFNINPLELGVDGSVESARGLKRIYIRDLNRRIVSYGDIMVE